MGSESTDIIKNIRPDPSGRFEVLRSLGEGAAGAVYQVRDRANSGRELALKILNNEGAFDHNTRERFQEELAVCRELDHPNLVKAYEMFNWGEKVAFTMEYVNGQDLRFLLNPPRAENRLIDSIFTQLLSALSCLHSRGILHRDVKLENVLIDRDSKVKLVDLGLVKYEGTSGLTKTGVRLGTLRYLAPEYLKQGHYDARSDLYSVGCMLYELMLGDRRLSHLAGQEALEQLIRTRFSVPELDGLNIPSKYKRIIRKAMAPEPMRRYQSAAEMVKDFEKENESLQRRQIVSSFDHLPLVEAGRKRRGIFSGSSQFRPGFQIKLLSCFLFSALLIPAAILLTGLMSSSPLSWGSYEGYVEGFSESGATDRVFIKSGWQGLEVNIPAGRCYAENLTAGQDLISCTNVDLKLKLRDKTSSTADGFFQEVPAGRAFPFFVEKK